MPDPSTGESQPADDIRSALASAIATHEPAAEAPAPKPEPKAETPAEPEVTDAEVEAQLAADAAEDKKADRNPDGTFKKKEEAAAKPDDEAAKADADKKADDKKPDAIEPPVNWKAEDKETFKKLPVEAQKIVGEMVKRQDADYTRKTQAIAAFKSRYEGVDKLFEPHRETMKQKGLTEAGLIEAWASVETKLTQNPIPVIVGLVSGYNVDRKELAAALGLTASATAPPTQGASDEAPPTVVPPQFIEQVRSLLAQEIAPIKETVTGLTTEQQRRTADAKAASEARIENEIDQFRSAKDEKGNLLRPHFDDVAAHMTLLARAAVAAKQPIPPLSELYETAVWANPSTREKLRTAETQQAEQKRMADARAKAAAAKKAASSVTGAPGPGQAANQPRQSDKSLREQLEEAAEDSLSAA